MVITMYSCSEESNLDGLLTYFKSFIVCQCPIFMSVITDVKCVGRLWAIVFYVVCTPSYVPCTVVGCDWFVQCMRVCKYCILVFMYHCSCSVLCWHGVCCSICWMVFVVLYVICKFVCLNKLVVVRMVGLKYVKVLSFVGCDMVGCGSCCVECVGLSGLCGVWGSHCFSLLFVLCSILFVCRQGSGVGNTSVLCDICKLRLCAPLGNLTCDV